MASTSTELRFRSAFEAHYRAIYSYAARRVGADDAADITAEVFTVAWRRIDQMPPEPETLPWLYAVARRAVANHRRGAARRSRLHVKAVGTASDIERDADDPIVVRQLLDQLRADDREILMLTAWEELTPTEIATVLGCSAEAARVRLHRARRRFAERIATEFGGTN